MYELSPDSMCKKNMAGEVILLSWLFFILIKFPNLKNYQIVSQNFKIGNNLDWQMNFSPEGGRGGGWGGDGWIQSEVILNAA